MGVLTLGDALLTLPKQTAAVKTSNLHILPVILQSLPSAAGANIARLLLQPKVCAGRQGGRAADEGMGASGEESAPPAESRPLKTSREVHFCVLPDKYQPLIEEVEEETAEDRRRRKEQQKEKKKKKYKKYRKNVGRALRLSWRCLLAGLHSMATPYAATPAAVATAFSGAWPKGGSSKA